MATDKIFYFIVSGAVSAASLPKAKAALEQAMGNYSVMSANIEGIREIRTQIDIDDVNKAVCKDCIDAAVARDRSRRLGKQTTTDPAEAERARTTR